MNRILANNTAYIFIVGRELGFPDEIADLIAEYYILMHPLRFLGFRIHFGHFSSHEDVFNCLKRLWQIKPRVVADLGQLSHERYFTGNDDPLDTRANRLPISAVAKQRGMRTIEFIARTSMSRFERCIRIDNMDGILFRISYYNMNRYHAKQGHFVDIFGRIKTTW